MGGGGDGWHSLFAELAALEGPAGVEVRGALKTVELPKGAVLLRQGEACTHYLLVVEGSVKVFSRAENGRELLLYRIRSGGSCILTTSCLLSGDRFPAEAVAETDVRAVVLPQAVFDRGLAESRDFRRFVFDAYGQRAKDLILLVEQVAFGRLDVRLAKVLLAQAHPELHTTHQALAGELGTAREVISRQLKEFEQRNWVALFRGSVRVLDRAGLEGVVRNAL